MRIYVAGNLGSGKTTLAKAVAGHYRISYEPKIAYERSYILDGLAHPKRWSFEAQVSFLLSKHASISGAVDGGRSFVLDRSIYEDAEIFERYFNSLGHIDLRAHSTYLQIYAELLETLPPPDLLLVANASLDFSKRTMEVRKREHQRLYPANHLIDLHDRYTAWVNQYDRSPKLLVDPEKVDFRESHGIATVAREIELTLGRELAVVGQGELFVDDTSSAASRSSNPLGTGAFSSSAFRPRVYIAAPFTHLADAQQVQASQTPLFYQSEEHGALPADYRALLNGLSSRFKRRGFDVMLPHRDINKWGNIVLDPSDVVETCLSEVAKSDLVFAILGESFGSHMEIGVALGKGIPVIAVKVGELGESFFAMGLRKSDLVSQIDVKSWEELRDVLTPKLLDVEIDRAIQRSSSKRL